MDGITVLSEHFCRAVELKNLIVSFIIFGALIVFLWLFYIFGFKSTDDKAVKRTIVVCFVISVVVFISFARFQIKQYHTTHTEYTITIDDSVGFHEFYSKYEIVSVDGEEYRVIEKHIKE